MSIRQNPALSRSSRAGASGQRRQMRRAWRAAFTMVEMLIVIAIICLLLTMLIPMAGKLREQARTTACLSNVRTIYMAMVQTEAEIGRLPRPPKLSETMANSTGGPDYLAWDQPQRGIVDFQKGRLWKHIGETVLQRSVVLKCPSDIDENMHLGGMYLGSESRNFTYSLNAKIRDEGVADTPIRLGQVAKPSQRIMIFEEVGPNDGYCVAEISNWDDQPSGRHGGGALDREDKPDPSIRNSYRIAGKGNFGFFDGHVESMTPMVILSDQSYYRPLK